MSRRNHRSEETVVHPLGLSDVVERRWRIEKRIGSGSMGSVFSAWDIEAQEKVAVKILSPELCRKPTFLARFEREARLMAELDHPNLVPLRAVGRRGALPFIVMPMLEGVTLADHLQQRLGKLAPVEAFDIVKQVCAGLAFLHEHGLVHRDVKPGNLFLSPRGHVTLLDLGVVRDLGDPGLTRPGVRIGTPYYMAPEQVLGHSSVDHRADLYALGAVVYELFTGSPPFLGQDHHEVLRAHRELPPPDAAEVSRLVSRGAAEVITRSLAKDPRDRFQSAGEFFEALEAAYDFSFEAEEERTMPNLAFEARLRERGRAKDRAAATVPPRGPRARAKELPPEPAPPRQAAPSPPAEQPPPGRRLTREAKRASLVEPESSGPAPGETVLGRPARRTQTPRTAPPVPMAEPSLEPADSDGTAAEGTAADSMLETEDGGEGTLRVIPLAHGVVTPAQVVVDGEQQGKGPLSVALRAGAHRIRAEKPGYRPREEQVMVLGGERRVIRIELEPEPLRGAGRR